MCPHWLHHHHRCFPPYRTEALAAAILRRCSQQRGDVPEVDGTRMSRSPATPRAARWRLTSPTFHAQVTHAPPGAWPPHPLELLRSRLRPSCTGFSLAQQPRQPRLVGPRSLLRARSPAAPARSTASNASASRASSSHIPSTCTRARRLSLLKYFRRRHRAPGEHEADTRRRTPPSLRAKPRLPSGKEVIMFG